MTIKKSTAIQITTADVPGQIEILQRKPDELTGSKDETVSTNVSFDGVVINSVKTVTGLLKISAAIHARQEAFEKERERYNCKNVAPYAPEGKSVEQWEKIISKAVTELMTEIMIKTMRDGIEKMSKYLGDQTKLDRDVDAIMEAASAPIL